MAEHIGVVNSLADLAVVVSILRNRQMGPDDQIHICLYAEPISMPDDLKDEFIRIVETAFPEFQLHVIPGERVGATAFDSTDFKLLDKKQSRRILYGAVLHLPKFISFYAYLAPDEFIFLDQGLSTYFDHDTDVRAGCAEAGLPYPARAWLPLSPALPVPAYLQNLPQQVLHKPALLPSYERLYRAHQEIYGRLPELADHLILGTSFFRAANHISWENERGMYLRTIEALVRKGVTHIQFKPHPRAADRPLITPEDGVEIIDTATPVEVFVRPEQQGTVYSISSSALFTMPLHFGWRAVRLAAQETDRLFAKRKQIGPVLTIPAVIPEEI